MSSDYDEPLKAIEGRARTVRELPDDLGKVRRGRSKAQPAYRV